MAQDVNYRSWILAKTPTAENDYSRAIPKIEQTNGETVHYRAPDLALEDLIETRCLGDMLLDAINLVEKQVS